MDWIERLGEVRDELRLLTSEIDCDALSGSEARAVLRLADAVGRMAHALLLLAASLARETEAHLLRVVNPGG